MSATPASGVDGRWIDALPRLEALQGDLALLPVGWGADQKGPMLHRWQHHPGFTIPELMRVRGIRSVGARTGVNTGPLLCFDFDGSTTVDLSCQLGFAPWEVQTWQVHRDTDAFRLKVLFRPTPEQIAQLPIRPDGGIEFQGKTITALKTGGCKGEALEVFFDGGRQVIVIGEHPSSGGHYFWPEGLGPEALAPPPPAWWAHALLIAQHELGRGVPSHRSSSKRSGSRRLDPCPICGRHSGPGGSALWCSKSSEGLVFCMPGTTFNAELRHGPLVVGRSVVDGWALVKRSPTPDGDVLTFKPHQPKIAATADPFGDAVIHQQEEAHVCPF